MSEPIYNKSTLTDEVLQILILRDVISTKMANYLKLYARMVPDVTIQFLEEIKKISIQEPVFSPEKKATYVANIIMDADHDLDDRFEYGGPAVYRAIILGFFSGDGEYYHGRDTNWGIPLHYSDEELLNALNNHVYVEAHYFAPQGYNMASSRKLYLTLINSANYTA